ncbi:MAG: hypothetical protein LBH29_02570, partial [Elusimicrobiota bacterium]|nr:hypothetical protein [Elusimicrobiota bacterium]
PISIYYKRQSLKKFGIFDDDKYITFQTGIAEAGYQPRLGRSWNIKNYLAMLDILKTKIDKSVKFVLVGNGNLSAVREAIKEKQLKINARFGGAANAPPEIFVWEGGGAIAL